MTKEELQQYKKDTLFYVENAQWHYRDTHPDCRYCECVCYNHGWECAVKGFTIDMYTSSILNKVRAKYCDYYIAKVDENIDLSD